MSIPYSDIVKQIPHTNTQMGVKMDLANIFGFISLIGPFFIMFMMFSLSIFNSNFKGFIYLFGVTIMYTCIIVLQKTLGKNENIKLNAYHYPFCQLFGNEQYLSIPSFNSALYMFTLIYLVLPMLQVGTFNLPLVIFFIMIYALDTITRTLMINCTTGKGVAIGSVIGFIWGSIFYNIISTGEGTKQFLYYDDFVSNKIACLRPSKQKFKCSVYKNGELIQSI